MPRGPFGELLPYYDVPDPEIPDPESIGAPPVGHETVGDVEIPDLVLDEPAPTLDDLQALREQALAARGMLIPGAPEAANFATLQQLREAQAGLAQLEPMEPALLAQEQRRTIPQAPVTGVPAGPAPLAPGQTPEMGAAEVQAAGRADVYSNAFGGARQALGTSQQIAGVQDQISADIAGLQQRYASASPEERPQIAAELNETLQERAAASEVKALADDEVAVEQAKAAAAVKSEYERYALAENQKVHDELAARRAKVEAEVAQKRMDREAAVAKVDAAEKRYLDLLKRQAEGDTATTLSGVAAMIGEMWQAWAERRPPNTAAAIENILRLGRERLQGQRDAASAEVQSLSGDVEQIDASIKAVEADRAEQESAILTDLTRRLELERMRASGTPREIAIAQAEDATRGALAAKRQEATEKRAEAVQDQRLKEEEIRLKSAQADKALAEAGIAERRAMGTGTSKDQPRFEGDPRIAQKRFGLDEKEMALAVWPTGRDNRPALATTIEEAKELRDFQAEADSLNEMLDQLVWMREKYKGNWELIGKSAEYQEMAGTYGDLLITYNKTKGLGALDKDTVATLDKIFGGDPNSLTTDISPSLRGAKARLRSRAKNLYKAKAGYTGPIQIQGWQPSESANTQDNIVDNLSLATRTRDPDGALNPPADRISAIDTLAESFPSDASKAKRTLDDIEAGIVAEGERIDKRLADVEAAIAAGDETPRLKAERDALVEDKDANKRVLAHLSRKTGSVQNRQRMQEKTTTSRTAAERAERIPR